MNTLVARLSFLLLLAGVLVIQLPTALGAGLGPPDFGDGSDGPMTFSSSTEYTPPADGVVDSGSEGGTALTLSGVSGVFQPGQQILIHQTRGTGAGNWELNTVQSYALGNKVTVTPLAYTYSTSGSNAAQALVVPQYTNVTVNAGVTLSAKPWNGATGGILAFLANGTITVSGAVSASEKGFLGGADTSGRGFQGEGTAGVGTQARDANGNGGGGGEDFNPTNHPGAGGGGHATAGTPGSLSSNGQGIAGSGGNAAGSVDLTTMVFGGGGGSRAVKLGSPDGGDGGGIILINGATVIVTGSIRSDGQDLSGDNHGQGGGAGGAIFIQAQALTLGTSLFTAAGGAAGTSQDDNNGAGGAGADGRIRVEYCTSISGGIADPPASVAQISCEPKAVGGVAELLDTNAAPLETSSSSGVSATLVAAIAAGAVGVLALASVALFARRRRAGNS